MTYPSIQERLRERAEERYEDDGEYKSVDRNLLHDAASHINKLEEALADLRDHGTRHDANPTTMFHECGGKMWVPQSLLGYIADMDHYVRERAARALLSTTHD